VSIFWNEDDVMTKVEMETLIEASGWGIVVRVHMVVLSWQRIYIFEMVVIA